VKLWEVFSAYGISSFHRTQASVDWFKFSRRKKIERHNRCQAALNVDGQSFTHKLGPRTMYGVDNSNFSLGIVAWLTRLFYSTTDDSWKPAGCECCLLLPYMLQTKRAQAESNQTLFTLSNNQRKEEEEKEKRTVQSTVTNTRKCTDVLLNLTLVRVASVPRGEWTTLTRENYSSSSSSRVFCSFRTMTAAYVASDWIHDVWQGTSWHTLRLLDLYSMFSRA
jgi:hypothetical protein